MAFDAELLRSRGALGKRITGNEEFDEKLEETPLSASDWPQFVQKAFPFDDETLKSQVTNSVPATLRLSPIHPKSFTSDQNEIKKFAQNFIKWKELFDLAKLNGQDVLELFGGNVRRVVDLNIRPGFIEGAQPHGSVYIFADSIPASEFGEALVFPLRENGFALESAVPGQSEDRVSSPLVFATFSKPYNRHSLR